MGRLTISGLYKFYGATDAVRGVDLDFPGGEFAVLVGPSGCGKRTLLRAIAGSAAVDRGGIAIPGQGRCAIATLSRAARSGLQPD